MRRITALAAASALSLAAQRAPAFCPSYTPEETAGGSACGVSPAAGHNPTVSEWKPIFAKVAGGAASWGDDGPSIGAMSAGCNAPTPRHDVPAHFPCHLLMAIAMQESGWRQFCVPDTPAASVGAPERTVVSFDCGYGVGQVTSGMHAGEAPAFDRGRVASDPTYNLATGTRILSAKWGATSCVGDRDPDVVEDWYSAIWAYNGLSYSNNPNNPNLTSGRGPYDPKVGGSYTYQERVLGWMEHPPDARWQPLAPAYPNRGDIGTSGSPRALPEPSCASPTSCASTRATHRSVCSPAALDAGPPPVDAGDAAAPPVLDASGDGIDGGDGSDGAAGVDDGSPPSAGDPAGPAEDGGCSCHVTPRPLEGGALPLLAALFASGALFARRRSGGRAERG